MKHIDYDHEIKKIKSTKKLRELFAEFVTLSKKTLTDHNSQKNPDYYKVIYQNLFQRLYIGISAIDTLFDKFNQNKYFKYPIAIQMRTCILDSISIAGSDNFTNGQTIKLNNKIKELKPGGMAKALKGTPLEWYGDIYKLYQHYSKYEHYGTVSKNLLEFETEFEFDKLTFSTFYVFQAAYMALQFMEVDTDKIERMKNLRDKIIEVEPTFDKQKH